MSFFFLFDPTLVVFTRLFRCAFFLLTPVMSTTKHEEIKITRRSLRNWLRKSTEHKSLQTPSFSPDRRKWRQGSLLQGKEIDLKSLNFWCKAIKMESRDGKGSRSSSGSQRQSSEFYAGDSTINYIWQVFWRNHMFFDTCLWLLCGLHLHEYFAPKLTWRIISHLVSCW